MTTRQPPRIIGLIGRAGAGKDTAADLLIPHGYVKCAFADPLRAAVSAITGWPPATYLDRETKERVDPAWGVSPREFLQKFGTEVGRALRQDLWLQAFDAWLTRTGARRVVVPDVRFPNEAEHIEKLGGELWVIRRESVDMTPPSAHASEHMAARFAGWHLPLAGAGSPERTWMGSRWRPWSWSRVPWQIMNNTTVEDLRDVVTRVLLQDTSVPTNRCPDCHAWLGPAAHMCAFGGA